ncbi:hypothetical protein GCM10027589_53740 [Actinocorallia lasiicapitis]
MDTVWVRKDTTGGFTLVNGATGQCMARGAEGAGVFWEGGSEYKVAVADCGGPDQIWHVVNGAFGTSVTTTDGYFLQADWSGLQPPSLKPASFAGMAAQGWNLEGVK